MAGSDNEVTKNLEEFILKGFPNAIEKAITEACLLIEREAKERCPAGSGVLRRSITHEVENNVGYVGTNVDYAPYVEIGTGIYSSDGNGRQDVPWRYQDVNGNWHTTSGMPPQPFLKPAVEENRNRIQDCFKEIF